MSSQTATVFITGATGQQGYSLATQLLALNWKVRSTSRKISSPIATKLIAAGVHLTEGDWDDSEALTKGISGCEKLFMCLMTDGEDPDNERRQAERIIGIARTVGVKQVVTSTSLGVSMYPNDGRLKPGTLLYPVLVAKARSEEAVRAAGFESWTFLHPAYFMTNFTEPMINLFSDILNEHCWTSALTPETKIGLVDLEDTVKIACAALQEPDKFNGRVIGIASELISPEETMRQLGEAMGAPLKAAFMTEEEIEQIPYGPMVLAKCDRSMRYMDEYVDMEQLKAITTGLTSFKDFLKRERARVKRL